MPEEELTALEKATLIALADECSYSTHAHVPEGQVLRNFQSHLKGDVKKALKNLAKTPLVCKHPTRGNMTYQITQAGLTKAQQ